MHTFRTITVAVTLLCALVPMVANAQRRPVRDEPRPAIYHSANGAWLLDLPPEMEDALDRYNRDFEPWDMQAYGYALGGYDFSPRQIPWAVIGDFNGDGRTDVAIAGRDDRDALVVFIVSTGRSRYRALDAEREPYDPDDPTSVRAPQLNYVYPGRYVVDDARLRYPRELLVDQPAVQITGGRRQGAILYVMEQNTLVPYYLSDRPAPPAPPRSPDRHRSPADHRAQVDSPTR
jgi:hypothetical protein